MSTRYKLSEQVMSLLRGGAPSVASRIKMPEVMTAVGQAINSVIKRDFYTLHISEERNANGLITATFEDVKVERYRKVSRSLLPVFPVKLPWDMGIHRISTPGCPSFIPIPSGASDFMTAAPPIDGMFGQICYEHKGAYVIYDKDISGKTVDMELVVANVEGLSDHEPLPLPADMELDVIKEAYKLLAVQNHPDTTIDANAEYKPQTP